MEKSLWYFVLLYYSHKSWLIFKTRDRFEICWSWRFQNTPYMCNLTKFWLRYLRLKTQDTILLFSWELIWEDEKNRNLNNLIQELFCSKSKVPIWTRMIFRSTIKRSRMFHQLLLTQNVQISIVFLLVKSIIMKIKEWYHVSLTSNISATTWSNWTCHEGGVWKDLDQQIPNLSLVLKID